MNTTRQDAWSKDEDIMLAETVLRYIREGHTQLEAFKEVAKKLSRTSAACGFRWNATIRKQYHHAIQLAKEERKLENPKNSLNFQSSITEGKDPIDTAILLLKKMKYNPLTQDDPIQQELKDMVAHLKEENEYLKEQLFRYDEAWKEMGNLWAWVRKENE